MPDLAGLRARAMIVSISSRTVFRLSITPIQTQNGFAAEIAPTALVV